MKKIFYTFPILMLFVSCSGPLYQPQDLKKESKYEHLLEITSQKDKPNYFVINDSISLYYFSKGMGNPIIVIHGGPGYPYDESWEGLSGLENDYKFYYYHQRGCGKSTRPFDKFESSNFYKNMNALNENLGLPAQIADIEQIRRKLNQEKITIIGHSFGGFLASLYAIEFPGHVESLILVSPAEVVKMPAASGGLYELVKQSLPNEKLTEYQDYLDKCFNYKNLFEKSEQQLVAENEEFIKYYNLATKNNFNNKQTQIGGWIQHACFLSMGKKHDYSESLKQIMVPTLIIHGKNDIIPVNSCNQYHDNIPNSELKDIPNSTHFPYDEQPKEFERVVKKFLNREK